MCTVKGSLRFRFRAVSERACPSSQRYLAGAIHPQLRRLYADYPSIYDHTKLVPAVLGLLAPVGWGGREDTILEQATRLTLMVSLTGAYACRRGSLCTIGDAGWPIYSAANERLPRVGFGRSS